MSKLMEVREMSTIVVAASDLDDRITAAFGDDVKSDDVKALIVEAETASFASGKAAEQARGRALDPALTANDVAEARRQMEDAAFRRERLQTAVSRLQERLKEVRAQEEDQRRRVAYAKAQAERDKLAAELNAIYPPIEAQFRDLMARLDANDKQIEYINAHVLPRDAERLLVAELVARGLKGFVENSVEAIRITKDLRLPAFRFDQHDTYARPRPAAWKASA
jgi:predicted RNase H-like nuclease (RuvC/YqgF family)